MLDQTEPKPGTETWAEKRNDLPAGRSCGTDGEEPLPLGEYYENCVGEKTGSTNHGIDCATPTTRFATGNAIYHLCYQVSMFARFFGRDDQRGTGTHDRNRVASHRRVSAGSITSSISKCDAAFNALPC